jgi:beta-galactosidase
LALVIGGSGKRVAVSVDGDRKRAARLVVELDRSPAGAAAGGAPPIAEPSALSRRFTVRLYFLEPDGARKPGQRVFDVAVQGRPALRGLDVAAAAGGPLRTLVRTVDDVPVENELAITLTGSTDAPPLLSGVEIVEQERTGKR